MSPMELVAGTRKGLEKRRGGYVLHVCIEDGNEREDVQRELVYVWMIIYIAKDESQCFSIDINVQG